MTTTAKQIGTQIGKAIARDTIADSMPHVWTGIDPQDADQIPKGMDINEVEQHAKEAFLDAIAKAE